MGRTLVLPSSPGRAQGHWGRGTCRPWGPRATRGSPVAGDMGSQTPSQTARSCASCPGNVSGSFIGRSSSCTDLPKGCRRWGWVTW